MNIMELLEKVNAGGVVAVVVIILSLIEITPIKLSPLAWVGKRVNKEVNARMDKMEKGMSSFGSKLDEHIAQSYRNKILSFQGELLANQKHTLEEFNEVIEACQKYEKHCKENKVENDKCTLAINFIKWSFSECQKKHNFAIVPETVKNEADI